MGRSLCGLWLSSVTAGASAESFSLLADGPRTLTDICDALNIKQRPAEAILTVATALSFLSLQEERYSLTAVAEEYLLESSSNYFGFSGI